MSQLDKWQFKEFFQNDREKVIQLLISEIIFLDKCLNKATKRKERKVIKKICKKLEKLLNIQQRYVYGNLSEEDYNRIIKLIFHTFNKAVKKLN